MFRSFHRSRGTTKKLESINQLEGLDELEPPDLQHLSELLRREQARGSRSAAAGGAHAVDPNIVAAANIIGLDVPVAAPNGPLLECAVYAPRTFGASPSYSAPSAACGPATSNKRRAERNSECVAPMPPKASRVVGMDPLPAWAPPQRWAVPAEQDAPVTLAVVTPETSCANLYERAFGDPPPEAWMGSHVHDAAQLDDGALHDKSLVMIDDEDAAVRDALPMLSTLQMSDANSEAESWWKSAGYFVHAVPFGP